MSDLAQNAVAGLAGAAAGAVVDSESGAFSGANQAIMADAWNRQLHREESKTLADLTEGKSPEAEQRLVEAAACLTQASKGVPDSDPKKAKIIEMEARGKAHTAELKQLRETGLYRHQMMDGVEDWLGRHDEGIERGLGVLQTAGGLAGVAGGATLAAVNPLGVVLGAGVATLSVDAIAEGAQRALGSYQSTEGQRVLDALDLATFPGERNRLGELGMDLATSVGMGVAGKLATGGARALRGLSFFGAEAAGPSLKALGKRPAHAVEANISQHQTRSKAEILAENRRNGLQAQADFINQQKAAGKDVRELKTGLKTDHGMRFHDAAKHNEKGDITARYEVKTPTARYPKLQQIKDQNARDILEIPVELVRMPPGIPPKP